MDLDDIQARLNSIDTGAPPQRPQCVGPNDTWQVPIGAITIRHHDPIAAQANETHAEQPGLLMLDGYRRAWTDERISCPSCGNADELLVRGRWGEPSILICPSCDHNWALDNAETSACLLQRAIVVTIEQNGVPTDAQQG